MAEIGKMNVHTAITCLRVASVALGLSSAVIGAWIATKGTASDILASVINQGGPDIFGAEFKTLLRSLVDQGRWTALAAASAGSGTLAQGVALLLEWRQRTVQG